MTETRRSFRHLGEAQRREDLIAAALELMAEGGPAAATLRAVAARAGVTPGLIRHYFDGKEGLLAAAYDHLMAGMSGPGALAADTQPTPGETLAHFIRASLSPPVMDAGRMALWAGFIHMVRSNPDMRANHRRTYLAYSDH
ncbi:MAG: TetR family transcriptional regulator [Paracoccaceae bacterium]